MRALSAFPMPPELSHDQRLKIVERALVLLEHVYVHVDAKRALYGSDALHRLHRLRRRLYRERRRPAWGRDVLPEPRMSDATFHRVMISIFASLRDLHTLYLLPPGYRGWVAFLPFTVEAYADDRGEHFVVTTMRRGYSRDGFRRGVELCHWNGVPIARAVELHAELTAGANPAARRAKGLARLTCRYVGSEYLPDEDWVDVGYLAQGRELERRFEWRVGRLPPERPSERHRAAYRTARDQAAEMTRRVRTAMLPRPPAQTGQAVPRAGQTSVPNAYADLLDFRRVERGRYGYLRIYSFDTRDPDGFASTVRRLLQDAPPAGLMIDVRNNPGGDVAAGEKLLQLLTGKSIEPQRYRIRASSLVERLVARDLALKPWLKHFATATVMDERLTASEPISLRSDLNRLGQAYYGPVVLIVDALSYSTTDMFAAGFQDHEIGDVLGVSATTGAGGGTLADYGAVVDGMSSASSPLRRLRSGASFSVALMRAERVGERAGAPIEDLGVIPTVPYQLTRDDLLERNRDLIAAAGHLLTTAEPRPAIGARVDAAGRLMISARGVDQIDVFHGHRRLRSFEYEDDPVPLFIQAFRLRLGDRVRLIGYRDHRRVVNRWIAVD